MNQSVEIPLRPRRAESYITAMSALPATASPLLHLYSLKKFFALDPPSAGGHYELIAGVLYMVPLPSTSHAVVVSRLNLILAVYAAAHPRRCMLFVPRAAVWNTRDTYLEPDLFLVNPKRLTSLEEQPTTADLVVEVLSASTAVYDRTAKADTYAALRVRELWLVDLERQSIEQRVLRSHRWQVVGTFRRCQVVNARSFRGLAVKVSQVFS